MINAIAWLMLCSALVAPSSEQRHVDAVEIFYCDFSNNDINYDKWPDGWKRSYGPNKPHFVEVEMQEDATAVAGNCLTMKLNGGGALISSPAVAISDNFGYVVEARLRGQGGKYSRAQVKIDFCDENRQVLETATSKWYQDTNDWEKIHIGPVNVTHPEVRWAIISLLVIEGEHVDLQGSFSLDDVWLARLPRMHVHTNSPFNVYDNKNNVVVTCELSGIREQDPNIHFELLDARSIKLNDNTIQLAGRLITEKLSKSSDFIDSSVERPAGYAGSTSWHPPIKEYGYYSVKVSMKTKGGTPQVHMISIAVVPPMQTASRGEFGWSLAGDDIPLSFEQLNQLLPRTGISWVKLPVWYGESEADRGDQLVLFTEQLAAKDIDVVGVLDHPPADLDYFGKDLPADASIADLLSNVDSSIWLPSLDEVLTRLSLRVRWWQLGVDNDTSYAHFPNAEKEIRALREKLFRFGQDVSLGLGWPWLEAAPPNRLATWDFQQLSASPPLTGEELATYLALPERKGVTRWTLVEPLPRKDYDLETRTHDLVQQMISAKIHGATKIFAAKPFDDDAGLMSDQGTPSDLLLPWRTAASLLSGTRFLGTIQLPGASENRLFEDEKGTVLMVVWNQQPRQEVIYLGENVQVVDVWGRSESPDLKNHRHVLDISSLPKFVTGMNTAVAKMRLGAQFTELNIPSVFEMAHSNNIELRNTFEQGVGGTIRIIGPEGWQIIPDRIDFKLAAGDKVKRPFQIILPFDATSGKTPLRVDFEVNAEKPYNFSVYRTLNVGDTNIELELTTRLAEDETLVVEQRMINHGKKPVDFKCFLYAPGSERRRQRMQVFQLTNNWDIKTYSYSHGEDLLGEELLLRVEEIGGERRVLNHRVLVEE
ncbi:COG1470 family protein [Bythopirellula polymerisocia]|uniref:Uncharacterized protein n=1 Tax=Bythopirellula polymerisocia TaxID=2528003 RepID=A0A5C6CNT9_9BACT|nr:hypothetical protein [Bythopirellula polymerisocia]TWU26112.1 hypothetical protein Pla144_33290 [Bythopirellula polymerisocia]